jgi:branched-chain amino acid transport system substrate-binding protein
MSQRTRARWGVVAVFATTALLAGCSSAGGSDDEAPSGDPVTVGVIVSETGVYATQAKDFLNGFNAGLDYITDGTGIVAGHEVNVLVGDDTGQASVGTAKAKEFLGEGATILTGPTDSAIALAVAEQAIQNNALFIAGTSGTTATVGMDKKVFPTSGPSPAGNLVVNAILGDDPEGKTIAVIGQDVAFGQAQAEALKVQMEPLGVKVESFLLPATTTDFTPLAIQLKDLKPDFITSNWAAAGTTQLLGTLASQGVTQESTYFQFLFLSAGWPAIADALGDSVENALLYTTYFEGATGNEQEKALIEYSEKNDHKIEYDDLIGFNAALMAAHAIEEGDYTDGDSMADALQGWSFTGPSGEVIIRAEDNQITLPAFTTNLVKGEDGEWTPKLVEAFTAEELEPPVIKPLPAK